MKSWITHKILANTHTQRKFYSLFISISSLHKTLQSLKTFQLRPAHTSTTFEIQRFIQK